MRHRRRLIPYALVAAVLVLTAAPFVLWIRRVPGFGFAQPWALSLIPVAVALVLWAALGRAHRRRATLIHSRAAELSQLRRGLFGHLRELPLALRVAALTLLGVALARPQSTQPENNVDLLGIDVVVVLDLSGSMEETDLRPNRLEAAKTVIEDFIERRSSDRVGLVIFGREAFTYAPLTFDHASLIRMVRELRLGLIDGQGTAIGNGVGVALNRLRHSEARSKVVIVLTDGDNNAGNLSPLQAAQFAQALGIKLYTVLVGDTGNLPAADAPGMPRARYPVNPKLLEEMAVMTGGLPFSAADTEALAKRFESILQDLERSNLQERGFLRAELFPRFVAVALFLLLLEVALRLTRFRRLP